MNAHLDIIDRFLQFQTEATMSDLIAAASHAVLSIDDVYHLANGMAHSGILLPKSSTHVTADIASTGGPGSLSTLLAPLYLRAAGCVVPKLGVPGRPAGGVDVLAQLPGYKLELSEREIQQVLERCGYAHFLVNENFAPLDAIFFRYRQKNNGQNIPALTAASLLAKKIAGGLNFVGLDVRVASHGNFGNHFDEARNSASLFCAAAAKGGIKAVAELTDGRQPYQPYLGRSEAILALEAVLQGSCGDWLAAHRGRCQEMAEHVVGLAGECAGLYDQCSLQSAFFSNIEAQGSSVDGFHEMARSVANAPRRELTASRDGYASTDLERTRSIFERVNVGKIQETRFPDELGIILRYMPTARLRRGDALASIRVSDVLWRRFGAELVECFKITELSEYVPKPEETIYA
jgi:thymidine phosphorylase